MQVMFMVMVVVSQGLERFVEMILVTSWMEECAPIAWAANSTEPVRASSFYTAVGADAEADNLSEFSMGISVRHPILDMQHN